MPPDDGALGEPGCCVAPCTATGGALTLADIAAAGLARLVPPTASARAEFAWLPPRPVTTDAHAALNQLRLRPTAVDLSLLLTARRLELTDAELLVCALAREVELDPLWPHTVAALQGTLAHAGPLRPSLGLLARWLAAFSLDGGGAALAAARLLGGRALASGLLQLSNEDLPATERTLALHPQLLPQILAEDSSLRRPSAARFGTHAIELMPPPDWTLPNSWQQALDRHAALLGTPESSVAQLVLRAGVSVESAGVAACLGQRLKRPVARIHGVTAMRAEGEPAPMPVGVEAWLLCAGAIPLFVFEATPGDQVRLPQLSFYRGPVLIAVGADGDVDPSARGATLQWRLPLPPPAERAPLWRDALGPAGLKLDHEALACRYGCGVSTLYAAAAAAKTRARNGCGELTESHIALAACEDLVATTHGLSALAQWMPCKGTDEAFVADARLQQELALVLARCRWREQSGARLGPAIRARYAPGVKLLFIGASGTGKTLAAQWLAERLGKPLYRVDLAAVSSKYIGETEKNLSQLIARAEQLDCILLFDEADSMFGARTDVKQANDRFANTQTNYLLQRIEQFSGITVLTSNNKARLDDAFTRRLDHVIEFPLPRGAARIALWRAHLGPLHAVTDSQFARLAAEIDLPGGNIRNISLTAMLGAALDAGRVDGVVIEFRHLIRAAALEYGKLGRRLPDGLGAVDRAAPSV